MPKPGAPRILRAAVWIVIAAMVAYFAVEGGEYGTSDLLRQRRDAARLRHSIDSLARVVDTLAALHERVESDPAMQERIAREEFGMVRGTKELLYRFTEPPPPSLPRDTARRRR